MVTLKEELQAVKKELAFALSDVLRLEQEEVSHRLETLCSRLREATGVQHMYSLPMLTAGKPFHIKVLTRKKGRNSCENYTPEDQSAQGLLSLAEQMVRRAEAEEEVSLIAKVTPGKVSE